MRLDKLIEEKLSTTRKELKRLFQQRKVLIDGQVEQKQNRNVDSQLHEIIVAGTRLTTDAHYFLVHKPAGVVTAKKDSRFQTVTQLLRPADFNPAIYPVGRLDRDTSGLLLLTDNGQLGYDLLQPDLKVQKTYYALVNEKVTIADVLAFEQGICFLDGTCCQPAELVILSATEKSSAVLLTINEGKFHQVKKMFLACGKKVTRLTRIKMGPLELPQDLAPGDYRPLERSELRALKKYFR